MAGRTCVAPGAPDRSGGIVMRAVSFFGPACIGRTPAGFGSGGKTGEAVTRVSSSGGHRNGISRDSARGAALRGDDGGDRSGRVTVISGFWGSAGSAITNQVAPGKIAENSFVVTR
jgi:hypothetical protein